MTYPNVFAVVVAPDDARWPTVLGPSAYRALRGRLAADGPH
ncbi:hypothetical protein ACFYO0_09095 [Streptomyces sp. NPDC006365]